MKKKLVMIGIMLCLTVTSFSQVSFSVSKGSILTAATVGYRFNKIVPFIGFQYYGASANIESSSQEFDFNAFGLITNSYDTELKANVFLPSLGAKYFFLEREKLKAFTSLSFTLPIVTLKSGDKDDNKEINDALSNVILWGGELGVGVEYFVDEQFSIGGEFGLRYIHFSYSNTDDYIVIHPITGALLEAESSENIRLNISPTFSKISLNYYF
jgi:hypothetical protein